MGTIQDIKYKNLQDSFFKFDRITRKYEYELRDLINQVDLIDDLYSASYKERLSQWLDIVKKRTGNLLVK